MKKILLILLATVVAMGIAIGELSTSLRKKSDLVQTYRNNIEVLLGNLERFKIKDSLNAVKVTALELTVEELNRFRAEDAELIKTLKASKKELDAILTMQTQTIVDIEGKVNDSVSIRIVDSVAVSYDTLKVLSYHDRYLDIDITIEDEGDYRGNIETRDNLKIVEELEYARFLGFLWRTKRVKSSSFSAFSDNPHTKITGAEYIKIRK